jgi:hypothetical protein
VKFSFDWFHIRTKLSNARDRSSLFIHFLDFSFYGDLKQLFKKRVDIGLAKSVLFYFSDCLLKNLAFVMFLFLANVLPL